MVETDGKTKAQLETVVQTISHIEKVRELLCMVEEELRERGLNHDKTKIEGVELELFTEYTPKLKDCTYMSDEYKEYLNGLKPALDHHYSVYRHHPEHFPNGVNDMTLIDLLEMICDWKASTLRHHDGNILKSIELNTDRFEINPQLAKILKNTVHMFEKVT